MAGLVLERVRELLRQERPTKIKDDLNRGLGGNGEQGLFMRKRPIHEDKAESEPKRRRLDVPDLKSSLEFLKRKMFNKKI